VDVLDHVGPREHQILVAALFAVEVGRGELTVLDRGAHRAVIDEDMLLERL